ncbi:hypothetical protein B296_00045927 [Ensete ventricosum]|uniref:Uncharacterized protein n=1 Tax=Ensete ventricosum TaxID=4639 RepID=A0A426XNN0_ENSVE|nr:hypothetical protein B296_00045927 [Ensete ventricosum]
MGDSQHAQPFKGKRTLRCRDRCRSEERASRLGIQRNGQPFAREAPRGQASEEECFSTLLDLEGCSGDCIGEGSQSSKCIYAAEQGTSCSARQSSPKGMVVFGTSSGKNGRGKLLQQDRYSGGISSSMVRVTGELDCFSAHIRLREPGKSEDKVE